jgi:hypothetical protein
MASSSAVSATSPLGPAGSNSTMVLTNTTPGTSSVLSLPVGKDSVPFSMYADFSQCYCSITVEPPFNIARFKMFPLLNV